MANDVPDLRRGIEQAERTSSGGSELAIVLAMSMEDDGQDIQQAIELSLRERSISTISFDGKFASTPAVEGGLFAANADLHALASTIKDVTTVELTREFAESWEKMLPVFRVPVPSNRCGQLGPAGLDLRRTFNMQPIAIETGPEGSTVIDLNVGAGVTITAADKLWFGIAGRAQKRPPGQRNVPLQPERVKQAGVAGLERFLDPKDLSSVEIGRIPVIYTSSPLFGRLLLSISEFERHGINVFALSRSSGVTEFFPASDTKLVSGDVLVTDSLSTKKLLARIKEES